MNRRLTEPQIEEQLVSLANELQFPATPDIAGNLAGNLNPHRGSGPRVWYALASLALIVILVATPPVRAAMWQVFDAIGIDVRVGDERQSDRELEILDEAAFGVPVTLAEAEEAFGRPLRFPTEILPAEPDAVYLYQRDSTGLTSVTYAYAASADLPALPGTNIGAILTQITGPVDTPYLIKTVLPSSGGESVEMRSGYGYWVENGHLEVQPVGTSRYSAHVLVCLDGVTAYRLESMLDQSTSVQIAESMAEAESGNQRALPIVWVNETRRSGRGGTR